MPFIIGSTTPITAFAATAASMAFPPCARICAPACAASGLSAATMPSRLITRDRPCDRSWAFAGATCIQLKLTINTVRQKANRE